MHSINHRSQILFLSVETGYVWATRGQAVGGHRFSTNFLNQKFKQESIVEEGLLDILGYIGYRLFELVRTFVTPWCALKSIHTLFFDRNCS